MMDQEIVKELGTSAEDDGRVTCATMHRIARKLGVEPIEVGNVASESDVHASQCQLGLFGHSPRGQGKGRVVEADAVVSDELAEHMRAALVNGRLPCAAAWDIATELKLNRIDLGNAAETLDISIAPCQLGFF
jgi:hypothetical protein